MALSKQRCTEVVLYALENSDEEALKHFTIPAETLSRYKRTYKTYCMEENNITPILEINAKQQKLTDINRVLRKENRETYRVFNSLDTVYEEYVELLKNSSLSKFVIPKIKKDKSKRVGILHLSDLHANELIEPVEANGNEYNFEILSKRMRKFVLEAIPLFQLYKITHVYIFMTGDLMNSDRRLSEKMAQASSLVRASLLCTYIIQQAIIELAHTFKVSVVSVVGNESRLGIDDFDSSDIMSSSNWDYMIEHSLRLLLEDKGIEFIDTQSNTQTLVTLENGFNAVLAHGNYLKGVLSDKQISSLLISYLYKGKPVHGVFIGHIHSAMVGDIVSRSSSMCGGNAYSTNALNYISRASQNIYIVNEDLGYNGIKIDLQDTDGVDGYNIDKELERYNVRSTTANSRVVIDSLI